VGLAVAVFDTNRTIYRSISLYNNDSAVLQNAFVKILWRGMKFCRPQKIVGFSGWFLDLQVSILFVTAVHLV